MTTKTFCRYCRAYNVADEALLEHERKCDRPIDCETAQTLARLRLRAEQQMTEHCPGGDCGVTS